METNYNTNSRKKTGSQDLSSDSTQQNVRGSQREQGAQRGQMDRAQDEQTEQRGMKPASSTAVDAPEGPLATFKNVFNTISIPEIAILGAAGFVVWKNRAKIQNLLESSGIDVPFLNGDVGQLVQSGLNMFNKQHDQQDKQLHS